MSTPETIAEIVAIMDRLTKLECECCFSCDSPGGVDLPVRRSQVCQACDDQSDEKLVQRCVYFTANGGPNVPVDPAGGMVGGQPADEALLASMFGGTWTAGPLENVFCSELPVNDPYSNVELDA